MALSLIIQVLAQSLEHYPARAQHTRDEHIGREGDARQAHREEPEGEGKDDA